MRKKELSTAPTGAFAAGSTFSDKIAAKLCALLIKLRIFQEKRKENSDRFPMTNFFLLVCFPIAIVLLAEVNQMKYIDNLIVFIADRPSVILFDFIFSGCIFAVLMLVFRRGWLAAFAQTILYLTLSTVELFKFGANGNHLILTDMKMATNVKSLTSFAYIKITPMLVTYIFLAFVYVAFIYWFNPSIKAKKLSRGIASAVITAVCVCIVLVPQVSKSVFAVFNIDNSDSVNAFVTNEKFENNSFLAFLIQTTAENLSDRLEEPDKYGEDAIDRILDDDGEDDVPASVDVSDFDSPNVVVFMSEAFADFRLVDNDLQTDAYDAFDEICSRETTLKGMNIAPTFGAYTVRTEFELLFGMPVKSLNDPLMPQRLLLDRAQTTIPRYYSELGYNTYYVHSFLSNFYSRSRVYSTFGFDRLIFQDDFDVDVTYRNSYIEDKVIFNEVEYLIDESEAPIYVHATTMQNHQPYNQGENPNDELSNYLDGVGAMLIDLQSFIDNLEQVDEPTVVLFVGDHFPSFRGEGNIYDELGYNSTNCGVLFEQAYFIWSNYEVENPEIPDNMVSSFYLPYVLMSVIGTPANTFVDTMTEKMETVPIYSTQYDATVENDEELDMLTYDRILGDAISYGELPEVTEEERYGYVAPDEDEEK